MADNGVIEYKSYKTQKNLYKKIGALLPKMHQSSFLSILILNNLNFLMNIFSLGETFNRSKEPLKDFSYFF